MGDELTPDQVRDRDLAVLGPRLGPIYNALSTEVSTLHVRWKQYRALFGHSPDRIALLNETGALFFRVVHDVLWENTLLSMARVTDNPGAGKRAKLSLMALGSVIDGELGIEVKALADTANAGFVRDLRNRRFAHRNLTLALGTAAEPIPAIGRRDIEATLAAIRAVLNRVELHYFSSRVAYEETIPHLGGAEAVVAYLQGGLDTKRGRRERVRQGSPLPGSAKGDDGVLPQQSSK